MEWWKTVKWWNLWNAILAISLSDWTIHWYSEWTVASIEMNGGRVKYLNLDYNDKQKVYVWSF